MISIGARALLAGMVMSWHASAPAPAPGGNHTRPQTALLLATYEQADGAITVFQDGQFVEPYFAMRALLTAADLGLATDTTAQRWIAWQLQRLDADTTFRRYCRTPGTAWVACGGVDADDASLALWIQLLYRTAGSGPMPAAWRQSIVRSEAALAGLYDAGRGVYVISRTLPVSLFMDNIEILSSLETAARAISGGRGNAATTARLRVSRLRRAIDRVFWNKESLSYVVSTQQSGAAKAFYPDDVAQIFPAVFGYGSPVESASPLVMRWMAEHGRQWLGSGDQDYPWGLLATAAVRVGDKASAICWLGAANARRYGVRWNVLEESVYQALSDALSIGGAPPPCIAVWSGAPISPPGSR